MAEPVILQLSTHTGALVPYRQPKAPPTFNESTGDGVSWAGWTWNPITGCLHGCKFCYARAIANHYTAAFPAGFTPLFHRERLAAPANTKIPRKHANNPDYGRVFVVSMGDMFGRWVPDEWIDQILAVEAEHPAFEYLHLTRFPERYPGLTLPATAWAGTSVDEQSRVARAERAFAAIPRGVVKVRWLSLEPLNADLRFTNLSMFDWIVIGAQTATNQPGGVGRVPEFLPPLGWVLRLTDQAEEAGVRVHWKPNLRGVPGIGEHRWRNEYPEGVIVGADAA